MGEVYVFTCAGFNYMPKVRALFHSLKKHHPELKLVLALADEMEKDHDFSSEPVDETLPASQLNIPEWKRWAFGKNIVELSTGIKPFALLNLLSRPECSKVIYFDPDTVLFSRIDDILETLGHANLVITPHQTSSNSNLLPEISAEIGLIEYGIYNLGFIGVNQTEEGKKFAEWWAHRVYHFCRNDRPNGLFYDQRWLDLAPAFFKGVEIIKSSRHNVAHWNLSTRKMTGNLREGFKVNGEPLGFYHFSGFRGHYHRKAHINKLYSNNCEAEITEWYEKEIDRFSNDPLAKSPWAYDRFSNGEPITQAHRIIYNERVDLQTKFPDPFDCSHPKNYYHWCNNAKIYWMLVVRHIFQRLKNKADRKNVVAQLWEVFRAEGFSGIFSWVRLRSLIQRKIY